MTPGSEPDRPEFSAPLLLLSCLLVLVGLFPPEARGEAMAGCSFLIILLTVVLWRQPAAVHGSSARAMLIVVGVGLPLARIAYVPGAAVEPLAIAILAIAAGAGAAAWTRDKPSGFPLVAIVAGVGAWVSLHAVYQKLWGIERLSKLVAADPGLPDHQALMIRLSGGRAFASFVTPAALGGFLALALPITCGLAAGARGRSRKLWAAVAALQLIGLLTAASATSVGALFAAVAVAGAAWTTSRKRWAIGVTVLVLLLAGVAFQRGGVALRPFDPEGPWRLRAGNFRAAWSMASDHPWVGVGPGGFCCPLPGTCRQGGYSLTYRLHHTHVAANQQPARNPQ